MTDMQNRLKISPDKLDSINEILLNPEMEVINDFLEVVAKYGTPEEINAKADKARNLENLLALVKKTNPDHRTQKKWFLLTISQLP
jgi:histidinol phosphatase-like PHP family hydrolase